MTGPATKAPLNAADAPVESEPPSSPQLGLAMQLQGGGWSSAGPLEPLLDDVARAIARDGVLADDLPAWAAACVAFADDASVRALNHRYRGKDAPTNVLSFPAPDLGDARPADEPDFLGDIVLAAETVAAEARDKAIPIDDHIRHLVVHGVLHLLGFDHETDAEADEMEAHERRVLATLGVADPYGESP